MANPYCSYKYKCEYSMCEYLINYFCNTGAYHNSLVLCELVGRQAYTCWTAMAADDVATVLKFDSVAN